MSKLDFGGLKQKSQQMAEDPNVQSFISQAERETENEEQREIQVNPPKNKGKAQKSNPFKKSFEDPNVLAVKGKLSDRNKTCGDQLGIYLKRELEQWIDQHTMGTPGGKQIVINCLIAYGICSVIEQYQKKGALAMDFDEQWPQIRDFIAQFDSAQVA